MVAKKSAVVKQYGSDSKDSPFNQSKASPFSSKSYFGTQPTITQLAQAKVQQQNSASKPNTGKELTVSYDPTGPSTAQILSKPSRPLTVPKSIAALIKDPTQYNKTITDFLGQARDLLGGVQGDVLSQLTAQENAYRTNADAAKQQVANAYAAAQAFINGQRDPITQAYQTSIGNVGSAADAAKTSIQDAYGGAQAQQQAILDRLGIGDANISLINRGTTLGGDMAHALTNSASDAQAAKTRLAENQQTALNSNTSAGNAATLEGQTAQNQIAANLLDRLAAIASQRQSLASSNNADVLSLAQSLQNNNYSQWVDNYNRRNSADSAAMDYAMQQQQATSDAQYKASSLSAPGMAEYALSSAGVDPGTIQSILQLVQEQYKNNPDPGRFIQAVQAQASQLGLDPVAANTAASIYYKFFN